MTFAIIQYWLSGMVSSSGGMAGAEGIARAVGAAIAIVLWPWAFGQAVALANSVSSSMVTSGVQSRLGTILLLYSPLALAVPGLGLIVGIILALGGLMLLLGLLAMKLAMGATLAVIYILMPITDGAVGPAVALMAVATDVQGDDRDPHHPAHLGGRVGRVHGVRGGHADVREPDAPGRGVVGHDPPAAWHR